MSVPVRAMAAMTSHRITMIAISPGLPPARRAAPAAGPRRGRAPVRRTIRNTDLRSSGLPMEDGSPPPEVVVPAATGGIGAIGDPTGGIVRVPRGAAAAPADRTGGIGR